MKSIFSILIFALIYSNIFSTGSAECFTLINNNTAEVIFAKDEKPDFTLLSKVFFKNSKKKKLLYGVNSIFDDRNYLILGTEKGLVRLNKRSFTAERLTSKKYNVWKAIKDKGTYWMVINDSKTEMLKLVKYRNNKLSTILKDRIGKTSYDVLKSGKNNDVWIIRKENISEEINGEYGDRYCKITVSNTLSGLRKNGFKLKSVIYDYKTDRNGILWIASSEGIYSLIHDKGKKIKTEKYEYITNRLQMSEDKIHFINGDTLYNIKNGKVSVQEYVKDTDGSLYINNSYLKYIEDIGDDENVCSRGIIERKNNSINILGEDGLISDTSKIFNKLKSKHWEDYMENVSSYLELPNGMVIFIVSGHGHSAMCYDGINLFDGKKITQIDGLSNCSQMMLDRNKVWIAAGSNSWMGGEINSGGLGFYKY